MMAKPRIPISPEQRADMIAAIQRGVSVKAIAAQHYTTKPNITRWLREWIGEDQYDACTAGRRSETKFVGAVDALMEQFMGGKTMHGLAIMHGCSFGTIRRHLAVHVRWNDPDVVAMRLRNKEQRGRPAVMTTITRPGQIDNQRLRRSKHF